MVQLAEPRRVPPDVVIDEIVRTIVAGVRPRRLILFGSRARGDARADSDYDVVVEMSSAIASPLEFMREIDRLFAGGKVWSLNVFPRGPGEIERSANDPGTVDWDIVREGRMLYAAEGIAVTLAPPPSVYVREEPRAPGSSRRWATRASEDLEEARHSLQHRRPPQYACFLAQQSAEEYLKALLVRHKTRAGRTHNLRELLVFLRGVGVPLPALDGDCDILTPFATEARYGPLERLYEATARAALAAAERIAAAVIPLLD